MTAFTHKTFSVSAPSSQTYRDNWERTFRGVCGATSPWNGETATCSLAKGHDGPHHDDRIREHGDVTELGTSWTDER